MGARSTSSNPGTWANPTPPPPPPPKPHARVIGGSLETKFGTDKRVWASVWPWTSGKSPWNLSRCTMEGIQTFMAQGRSTKIISMTKWIWTSRLPIEFSVPCRGGRADTRGGGPCSARGRPAPPPASGQTLHFNRRDSDRKTPHSDERQYKSRTYARRFDHTLRANGGVEVGGKS